MLRRRSGRDLWDRGRIRGTSRPRRQRRLGRSPPVRRVRLPARRRLDYRLDPASAAASHVRHRQLGHPPPI